MTGKNHFDQNYLEHIRYLGLIMDDAYINNHWRDICSHANDIERRLDDSLLTPEIAANGNRRFLQGCIEHGLNYFLLTKEYPQNPGIEMFYMPE